MEPNKGPIKESQSAPAQSEVWDARQDMQQCT